VIKGELLVSMVGTAEREVVLIAPFVKRWALDLVLADLPRGVSLRCLTRWLPQEVASGVSDLEVLDAVTDRGGDLRLRADLHAKYFRVDQHVLIGSANLTGRALGWTAPANLELLVKLPLNDALEKFEMSAFDEATPATPELRAEIAELAKAFVPLIPALEEIPTDRPEEGRVEWYPLTRSPARLFEVYSGDLRRVTTAGDSQARHDLAWLGLPPGLSHEQFNRSVAVAFAQTPLLKAIDTFLSQPRRFGEGKGFIADRLGISGDAAEIVWQTVMRWLQVFFPTVYEITKPGHTEVVRRRAPSD